MGLSVCLSSGGGGGVGDNGWVMGVVGEDTNVDVIDEASFFLAVLSQSRTKDLLLSLYCMATIQLLVERWT